MSTDDQLSLFDLQKYSTPSCWGKPDWFYDTHDGVEDEPSVSKKKEDRRLEQTDPPGVKTVEPLLPSVSSTLGQINKPTEITGGGNLTPGGDRHIPRDRPQGEPDPKNMAMLQNASGDRSGSIASDSTPLTVEEGKAFWDALIFGRKTTTPQGVALETSGDCVDRKPGRSHLKRVQEFHNTPDIAQSGAANNAISSENLQLGDQRKHNGKPGASGWIGRQYKYRDHLGKSRTSSHWMPGCAGPYYHYQWREGDRITTIYLPKKKLEAVENAIARRESVNAILMMLG